MYVWFSLHHFPIPQYFLCPSKKLLAAIVISSHMEVKQSMYRLKRIKRKDTFFVREWLRQKGLEKLCEIFES